MVETFVTPELGKGYKLEVEGDDAKEIFIDFATRNGKHLKETLRRRIWEKHELPMFRGVPIDEVPFDLKIAQLLLNFKDYRITLIYHFVAN